MSSSSATMTTSSTYKLPLIKKLGYGLGHIQNDLCSAMWFTYLLIYFQQVLHYNHVNAGIVLLVGQIADGLSTPLVGIFSDKDGSGNGAALFLCRKIGSRRAWHVIGTICVTSSFPFIFNPVPVPSDEWAQLIYYSAFVIIFQFGWASVQISHLSMIPDITPCTHERTGLTAIRYSGTVFSNVLVYAITWAFLGFNTGEDETLGPKNEPQFRYISLIIVILGLISSIVFHVVLRKTDGENSAEVDVEPVINDDGNAIVENESVEESATVEKRSMGVLDWFKEPQFYMVAALYMFTRLFANLTQAYIPLYLQVTLKLRAVSIAIVPLAMYVSGFIVSFFMKFVNKKIGKKATFILGCLFGVFGCLWIEFGMNPDYIAYAIYGVAAFFGAGTSTMIITSLSVTADLIGSNTESGAFVYGAMSFFDKVSNGLAVIVIQTLIPGTNEECMKCRNYFKDILIHFCGGIAILGIISMLILSPFKIGQRRQRRSDNEPVQQNTANG